MQVQGLLQDCRWQTGGAPWPAGEAGHQIPEAVWLLSLPLLLQVQQWCFFYGAEEKMMWHYRISKCVRRVIFALSVLFSPCSASLYVVKVLRGAPPAETTEEQADVCSHTSTQTHTLISAIMFTCLQGVACLDQNVYVLFFCVFSSSFTQNKSHKGQDRLSFFFFFCL